MEYYKLLNLAREPFSSSPEPDFFYESLHHSECLQRLELVLRLRRGLSVVIGQVGAGKTTLSRQLIRKFSTDGEVSTYLMLDPHFSTEMEFLTSVARLFGLSDVDDTASAWQIRERIKNYLFTEAVEKQKLVVLIIDEGQKIPDFAMESLREFLNYETNEYKLLQIAVFAQEEFRQNLERHPGFADRINLLYNLGPLNFKDTCAMVHFRIQKAAQEEGDEEPVRFTAPALRAVYNETGGYPRKIVRVCHQLLLTMIIKNKDRVDWWLVREVLQRSKKGQQRPFVAAIRAPLIALFVVLVGAVVFYGLYDGRLMPREGAFLWGGSITATAESESVQAGYAPVKSIPWEDYRRSGRDDQSEDLEPAVSAVAMDPLAQLQEEDRLMVMDADPHSVAVVDEIARKATETTENGDSQRERYGQPATLGAIEVVKGQFICRMLRTLYGVCNEGLKSAISEANPDIENLDYIIVGQKVTMPAIVDSNSDIYARGFWIRLGEDSSINAAYTRHRFYGRLASEVRILPYWTAEDGLRFATVFRQSYPDEGKARLAMETLPDSLAADSDIVKSWPEEALFYGKR